MLSKVFLLLALAARASAFASLPKAPAEESIETRETRSNLADAPNSGSDDRQAQQHFDGDERRPRRP